MTTSRYEKADNLKREWEALGDPSDSGFVKRLQQASIETVVTARRVYSGRPQRDAIDRTLIKQSGPRLRAVAWRMADGDATLAEEIEDELIAVFWEQLSRESFLEFRFNRALRFLALSARRKIVGEDAQQPPVTLLAIVPGDKASDDPPGVVSEEEIADTRDNREHVDLRLDLQAVLDQLPREVAHAMSLHYLDQVKIFSANAAERSVASVLGCSERKARDLIAQGLSTMRQVLGEDYRE